MGNCVIKSKKSKIDNNIEKKVDINRSYDKHYEYKKELLELERTKNKINKSTLKKRQVFDNKYEVDNYDYDSEFIQITQREAENGNSWAQYMMGWMYLKNIIHKNNFKIVVYWFTLSANNGNSNALNNLAYLYDSGFGVKRNKKKALELYNLSVSQRNSYAKHNLKYRDI